MNGSGDGIVNVTLEPIQRGYVMGFPVRTPLISVGNWVDGALTR